MRRKKAGLKTDIMRRGLSVSEMVQRTQMLIKEEER